MFDELDGRFVEQQSDDWFRIRIGKVGASRLADVMAKGKDGKPSVTRENYKMELLTARLTGVYPETYQSEEMKRGIYLEDEAAEVYQARTFSEVKKCGWYPAPDFEMSGASPDRMVDDDGLLEIKCPNTKTHLETILTGKVKREYILQMQWQMYCTGRAWCDFVSYDDRLPSNLKIYIKRFYPDEKMLDEIKQEVSKFLNELNELETKLRSM